MTCWIQVVVVVVVGMVVVVVVLGVDLTSVSPGPLHLTHMT